MGIVAQLLGSGSAGGGSGRSRTGSGVSSAQREKLEKLASSSHDGPDSRIALYEEVVFENKTLSYCLENN